MDVHNLARRHLSGDYTVEHIEFTDGDTRTKATHSVGWSPYDYFQEVLWADFGEIWLDSYENDSLIHRRIVSIELTDRVI